jgi:23S rRNA (pseudouridine1915-N3)-methyltransferase
MQTLLAQIGSSPGAKDPFESLIRDYLKRCAPVIQPTSQAFRSEQALFDSLDRLRGRTQPFLVLLDPRGRMMTSEAFAAWLGERRDQGAQHLIFAVGPADGWSEEARARVRRGGLLLSLGTMTLAHNLARLVLAEQIYRACTILTGHPYHRQ